MSTMINQLTVEEVYLIRSCNLLRKPDKVRIKQELEGYLELDGMESLVRSVLKKLEDASEDDLKQIWEIQLD